jgi:F420-0:gamma-glutamyl ligase
MGVRLPIISQGDSLSDIVAESLVRASQTEGLAIHESDVVAVTEAVVAKSQGNYASLVHIAADIRAKFPGGTVGVVFPIFSRNRFLNILKGISCGADKVFLLLSWPSDEVGNPIMDVENIDEVSDLLPKGPIPAKVFREHTGAFKHPFTAIDYIDLYQDAGDNIQVYLSNDPRDILKLTPHVLAADIHTRNLTKKRLLKAGAKTVFTLSDILSGPVDGSGFNPDYGVLGSNIATAEQLKLFPRDCGAFVAETREKIRKLSGVAPEVMVYGDGAFKDPARGIWELADPVVSPAHTERLAGQPNEVKIKMLADQYLRELDGAAKADAVKEIIRNKTGDNPYSEGTTPRKYADLLGSLCDLVSGSGDKGTPVIWVQGYFDSYADEADD